MMTMMKLKIIQFIQISRNTLQFLGPGQVSVAYLADVDALLAGVKEGAKACQKAMQQSAQVLCGAPVLLLGGIGVAALKQDL